MNTSNLQVPIGKAVRIAELSRREQARRDKGLDQYDDNISADPARELASCYDTIAKLEKRVQALQSKVESRERTIARQNETIREYEEREKQMESAAPSPPPPPKPESEARRMAVQSCSGFIDQLCAMMDMPSSSIFSGSRTTMVVGMRRLLVWMMRDYMHMSYPDIGEAMGSRNHSTIIDLYRQVHWRVAAHKDTFNLAGEALRRIANRRSMHDGDVQAIRQAAAMLCRLPKDRGRSEFQESTHEQAATVGTGEEGAGVDRRAGEPVGGHVGREAALGSAPGV